MKTTGAILLLASALLLQGCGFNGANGHGGTTSELQLVEAWLVDMPAPLEPSGLTLSNGQLYTVADKDDRTIYWVAILGDTARLVPAIRFTPPEEGMDWEGITCDPAGNFYLISESRGRILQVRPDGSSGWICRDLRPESAPEGLFAKENAGFEGVAWLAPNHWLGAVEREPRGLVDLHRSDGELKVKASLHQHSPYSNFLPILRIPDYSALDTDQGRIYALYRNAHLVVRLEKTDNGLREAEAWSYKHIETDPRWAYRSQTYGQAEGLVVGGNDVYIILDNNLGGRQADPNDGRPLLIHARMP